MLPPDSILNTFRSLTPAPLQLIAVRLTRSEAHSQMRWQTNPIDVDERIIIVRFAPASGSSSDSDDEGSRVFG